MTIVRFLAIATVGDIAANVECRSRVNETGVRF
jgi:hypothetical protein